MPHLLTILILLPFVGALALVFYSFAPPKRDEHYRWIALVTTIATFVVSLLLLRGVAEADRNSGLTKASIGSVRLARAITSRSTA